MVHSSEILMVLAKLCLAAVLAGTIGLERERKGRAAGLRTHVLVCLGSTLAMIIFDVLSDQWHQTGAEAAAGHGRVAAGILTGVGFLGAGTIINVHGLHRGLTTAAMIWFVAVLGICIGANLWLIAAVGTAFALLVVMGLEKIEDLLPVAERFLLTVEMPEGLKRVDDITDLIRGQGYHIIPARFSTLEDGRRVEMAFEITGTGHPRTDRLVQALRERFEDAHRIECTR